MPHLTLEYTPGAASPEQMQELCQQLANGLANFLFEGKSIYPRAGIRVRALLVDCFSFPAGIEQAEFLHATLKIGAGRSEAVKQATGEEIFALMVSTVQKSLSSVPIAFSLELYEFGQSTTWKHNGLHQLVAK